MSWVTSGMRRDGNQVVTSRSTHTKVIASPSPTKTRATSATAKVSASANAAWARVSTTTPMVRMRRGPNRSSRSPTGICMPA